MKEKRVNIAIDGPSGVGKTVMANMIAKKFNYKFLSSGNFYRIIAYNALKNNIDLTNEALINEAWKFEDIKILDDDSILFKNEDITKKIREDKISRSASIIAKFPLIRQKINKFIQEYAKKFRGVIIDGRDATYRILPEADVKFFLYANPEVRAKRRVNQDKEMGIESNYEEVLKSIKIRDYEDMNRAVDPLKVSEGSVMIDTSNMTVQENFEAMYKIILKELE
ncbi:(d)CMP kinase [Metamycoplasma buccale]|uniref:(d)CMP kinase n=1 Tax=Metamycoplasma buccale TaxID=55602 RepID=UPI00398EFA64